MLLSTSNHFMTFKIHCTLINKYKKNDFLKNIITSEAHFVSFASYCGVFSSFTQIVEFKEFEDRHRL